MIFSWIADENGFQPVADYLPTTPLPPVVELPVAPIDPNNPIVPVA